MWSQKVPAIFSGTALLTVKRGYFLRIILSMHQISIVHSSGSQMRELSFVQTRIYCTVNNVIPGSHKAFPGCDPGGGLLIWTFTCMLFFVYLTLNTYPQYFKNVIGIEPVVTQCMQYLHLGTQSQLPEHPSLEGVGASCLLTPPVFDNIIQITLIIDQTET